MVKQTNSHLTGAHYNNFKTLDIKEPQKLKIKNLYKHLKGTTNTGYLYKRVDSDGNPYIYLKVSEVFIEKLFPLIKEYSTKIEKGSSEIGAHISVIRPSMGDKMSPKVNQYLGKQVSFVPTFIATVEPDHDLQWERVWFLVVKSPELEGIRKACGLTPKLHDNKHDYHITIAVTRRLPKKGIS